MAIYLATMLPRYGEKDYVKCHDDQYWSFSILKYCYCDLLLILGK